MAKLPASESPIDGKVVSLSILSSKESVSTRGDTAELDPDRILRGSRRVSWIKNFWILSNAPKAALISRITSNMKNNGCARRIMSDSAENSLVASRVSEELELTPWNRANAATGDIIRGTWAMADVTLLTILKGLEALISSARRLRMVSERF